MRTKQRAFFRTRDACLVPSCRELESRVDAAVAEVLDPPPATQASLFGPGPDDAAARFAAAEKGGGI